MGRVSKTKPKAQKPEPAPEPKPPTPLRQWLDAHRERLIAHGCDDLVTELEVLCG